MFSTPPIPVQPLSAHVAARPGGGTSSLEGTAAHDALEGARVLSPSHDAFHGVTVYSRQIRDARANVLDYGREQRVPWPLAAAVALVGACLIVASIMLRYSGS
jgi:hypothetical protein